jgi:hypothetical protein
MEEQIIEAVRPHLVLYDTNHKDYVKSKLKEDIWSAIAKDLNLTFKGRMLYISDAAHTPQWPNVRYI